MLVSQQDIAEIVGVSQKTISLYFHDCEKVAPKTRALIEKAIRKYNYFPNQAARTLKSKKFKRIACVFVHVEEMAGTGGHPHFMAYIKGISNEFAQKGYSVVVEQIFVDSYTMKPKFNEFFSIRSVDAIVGVSGGIIPREVDERLEKFGLPVLWLNRNEGGGGSNFLSFDEDKGARDIAKFLLSQKKKDIVWFGPKRESDNSCHYSSIVRVNSLLEELTAGGANCQLFFSPRNKKLNSIAKKIVAEIEKLDAIVCYNFQFRDSIIVEAMNLGVNIMDKEIIHFASEWENLGCFNACFSKVVMPEVELAKQGAKFILSCLDGKANDELLRPLSGKLCINKI